MRRYPTKTIKKTGISGPSTYPFVRPDFPTAAYVVLTRETGLEPEILHG